MSVISLTLDVPPSSNLYWRCWRSRMVRSELARAYCNKVYIQARNRHVKPFDWRVPVVVTVTWFRAIRAGDLDNRLKVLLDAMQGVAYENDNQVVELHAFRRDDKENPRLEVMVQAVP